MRVNSQWVLLALISVGCQPDPQSQKTRTKPTGTTIPDPPQRWTADRPVVTIPTETTLYDYDCTNPVPVAMPNAVVGTFGPAEDFDLDGDGFSIQVFNGDLTARNKAGDDSFILSPNVATNAAGTRVLVTGDYVVADAFGAGVVLVDGQTGAKDVVYAAANWPNGIELVSDGTILVSEFAANGYVVQFDPYNPQGATIVANNLPNPNGLVLSPDEQTLYIAASFTGQILAIDRLPGGGWDQVRELAAPGGSPQGINVDICGHVYWTDGTDQILRFNIDTEQIDVVADLQSGYLPNLRWGSGWGGWEVDHLYASDRFAQTMYEVYIGIPGKRHVSRW